MLHDIQFENSNGSRLIIDKSSLVISHFETLHISLYHIFEKFVMEQLSHMLTLSLCPLSVSAVPSTTFPLYH